jgi:hypothetical protein
MLHTQKWLLQEDGICMFLTSGQVVVGEDSTAVSAALLCFYLAHVAL